MTCTEEISVKDDFSLSASCRDTLSPWILGTAWTNTEEKLFKNILAELLISWKKTHTVIKKKSWEFNLGILPHNTCNTLSHIILYDRIWHVTFFLSLGGGGTLLASRICSWMLFLYVKRYFKLPLHVRNHGQFSLPPSYMNELKALSA